LAGGVNPGGFLAHALLEFRIRFTSIDSVFFGIRPSRRELDLLSCHVRLRTCDRLQFLVDTSDLLLLAGEGRDYSCDLRKHVPGGSLARHVVPASPSAGPDLHRSGRLRGDRAGTGSHTGRLEAAMHLAALGVATLLGFICRRFWLFGVRHDSGASA